MSTAIIVGTMVGTGIFLQAGEVARLSGSIWLAILVWVVGGLLNLVGGLCYVELGTMMPYAGADYQYLKRAWGPAMGFLYGWKGVAVSHPASLAAAGAGIAIFASFFWPGLKEPLFTIGAHAVLRGQVFGAAVILVFTAINLLRVTAVGWVQTAFSALKIGSLVAVIVAGMIAVGKAGATLPPAPHAPSVTLSGFLAAVTATLWAYSGWHTLLRVGGEVKDPSRTMPRAVVAGFTLTAILFLLVNIACFVVLGFDRVAGSKQPVADMLTVGFGTGTAALLVIMMIISAVGSLNTSVMAAARLPWAIARDGLLPRKFGELDASSRVPAFSVVFMSMLALILVFTGEFQDLASLFVFTQWGFYLLSVAGLIRLRIREPDTPRVKVWGYPIVPGGFVLLAAALTVSQFIQRPVRSTVGLGLILLGLPLYQWLTARRAGPARHLP